MLLMASPNRKIVSSPPAEGVNRGKQPELVKVSGAFGAQSHSKRNFAHREHNCLDHAEPQSLNWGCFPKMPTGAIKAEVAKVSILTKEQTCLPVAQLSRILRPGPWGEACSVKADANSSFSG